MTPADRGRLALHLDAPAFLEAVNATAASTGFGPRLVEKDYFCTLLLQSVAPPDGALVFKGGTCLAKVHGGFYRLSEDLDFTIPTPPGASRTERSRRARPLKDLMAGIGRGVPALRVREALVGANNSTQYIAVFSYRSVLDDAEETIKFEAGLREPMLAAALPGQVKTLLSSPATGSPLVPTFPVACLSLREAMAEKCRAALCRREVAIRDFYDLDHAVRRRGFDVRDPRFVQMVRQKVAVPGTEPPDVSLARLDALRPQVEAELTPVVRPVDLADFDLERAFATVVQVARAIGLNP